MRGAFVRLGLLFVGCSAVSMAVATAPVAAQVSTKSYDIPTQPLGSALSIYAEQSGVDVVFAPDTVRGKRSAEVRGRFAPQTALDMLLRGSGLVARRNSSGGLIITAGNGVSQADISANGAEGMTADDAAGDIVVTAQKREERLREVPISISAVTGDQLQRQGVSRFSDYAGYIPGMSLMTSAIPGEGTINLRGVAASNSQIATTAMYVDDVPTTTHGTWGANGFKPLDLFPYDLERVEVLRGPQGTLYGDSTIGGLVKYVTKTADVNDFSGAAGIEGIAVTGGDGLGGGGRAMINVPLAPGMLGLRVSGFYQKNPGFVSNVLTGKKGINENEQRGLRVAMRVTPSDAFSFDAQWLHTIFEADGRNYTRLTTGARTPLYGDYRYNGFLDEPTRQEFDLASATARYDFGAVNLTSVTGYSRAFRGFTGDQTALTRNWIRTLTGGRVTNGQGLLSVPTTNRKLTQEVRLASGGDQRLSWLIGGYYSAENTRTMQRILPYQADGTLMAELLELSREDVKARYTDLSAFANATFKITDKWEISGGIRHSRITDEFHDTIVGTFQTGSPTGQEFDQIDAKFNATTWSLTTRYIASDDLMMFARAASGFRAGSVNFTWPGVQKSYDPDNLISYEAGIRADFLDNKASIDLTVYYLDWKDLFITAYTDEVSPLAYQTNGGHANGMGAEFTGTLRPFKGLNLTATAAYYGLKMRENLPTLGASAGDRTPASPAWSGSVLADYSVPLGNDWNLNLGGGVRWVTHTWSRFISDPRTVRLDGYAVADLNAAISYDRWTVRGYVRNLTNDNTILTDSPPNRAVQMNPRTIGLALDMRF